MQSYKLGDDMPFYLPGKFDIGKFDISRFDDYTGDLPDVIEDTLYIDKQRDKTVYIDKQKDLTLHIDKQKDHIQLSNGLCS